jgi:hypothetical protein
MRFYANLDEKPCTLMFEIKTAFPKKMYVKVADAEKPNTIFTNRHCRVDANEGVFVRMPIAPKRAVIDVISEEELGGGEDKNYKIVDAKKLPLKRKLTSFNHANPTIQKFVKFAEQFSAKAGYISAKGSIYTSDDGKFRIDYLDDITDESGKSIKTPARISRNEGIIEVSKVKFQKYSIPMRMAILLHEFSHFYLNTDMANETEADLNGLIIYLGLGYPRIDAYNVFTQVFSNSANELNANRMKIIDDFIRNFEEKYIDMQYTYDGLYKNYV